MTDPKYLEAREMAGHLWRAFATDCDGVCKQTPDSVFEQGFDAGHAYALQSPAVMNIRILLGQLWDGMQADGWENTGEVSIEEVIAAFDASQKGMK